MTQEVAAGAGTLSAVRLQASLLLCSLLAIRHLSQRHAAWRFKGADWTPSRSKARAQP